MKWGIAYKKDSDNPCKLAQAHGLQCLNEQGSLKNLIQLDRPAIVKLSANQDKEFYATVTAVNEQVATLVIGTETKLVDVKEVSLHWLGDYIMLWRMPPEYNGYVKQGSKGPLVTWLDERLALVQGGQRLTTGDPVFNGELVERVKEFQRSKGLKPDGIVGPQTLIHLNSVQENSDPVLSVKQEET
jgi:general secretion pathway protein A